MITPQDVQVLDINAAYYGITTQHLMENAGKAIATHIIQNKSYNKMKILILCGIGNNGGDGFVAARYLSKNYPITIFLLGNKDEIKTTTAQKNFQQLNNFNINIYTKTDADQLPTLITQHDLIIDAMLGIGITGNLREPYKKAANLVNQTSKKTVISIDIPTGLGTDIAIKPHTTITFHDIKEGMQQINSGKILITDIGIPIQAQTHIGPGELSIYYPKPKPESHKRDNGVVLIIGGGPYTGAPALAGMGAYRTGTDLVHIATPRKSAHAISCHSPNLIVHDLSEEILTTEDTSTIKPLLQQATSILIGPGLGTAPETIDSIQEIINTATNHHKPIVIDADAIHPFSKIINLIKNTQIIITPHATEYHKLTGKILPKSLEKRITEITTWAKEHKLTVLFKGPTDIITNGNTTKLNTIHNPAMTVGGTGDILAGIASALLSKNVAPFSAACITAFINGTAGNYAFNQKSYGLLPTDIIENIPLVLQKYL
jgi:NAD(P)H-hydrate epimerase